MVIFKIVVIKVYFERIFTWHSQNNAHTFYQSKNAYSGNERINTLFESWNSNEWDLDTASWQNSGFANLTRFW